MTNRREVRVADTLFFDLDNQLADERGPTGQPSATDFIVVDLPVIVERFATGFDELPQSIAGLNSIRMMIGAGALVSAFVVHGIETEDGVVQLVGIDIDL